MRKIQSLFTSSFAFIYLFLSLGIGLEAHYCHGNLSSISVTLAEIPCECAEGEEMSCCSTEEAVMQLDDVLLSQQKINTSKPFLPTIVLIEDSDINENTLLLYYRNHGVASDRHSPPLFLLNSAFLHYG